MLISSVEGESQKKQKQKNNYCEDKMLDISQDLQIGKHN